MVFGVTLTGCSYQPPVSNPVALGNLLELPQVLVPLSVSGQLVWFPLGLNKLRHARPFVLPRGECLVNLSIIFSVSAACPLPSNCPPGLFVP